MDMNDQNGVLPNLQARLELLFFDPSKSQSDYDILFKQLLPNIRIVAHSPLYQLRSDMLFCMNNDKWLSAIITRNARLRKFAFLIGCSIMI